jgi:hypothetical protein
MDILCNLSRFYRFIFAERVNDAKQSAALIAPGEIEPPKQISKAEREARKAFRQVDAATAMSEHEIAQAAFSRNRERLKAERLAREAAAPPPAKPKPRAKRKGS